MDVGLTIHSTGRHTLQKKIVNFRAETRTALLCVQKKKKKIQSQPNTYLDVYVQQ